MLEIKVHQDNQKTVSEILREQNHYLPAVCAGRGTCGKCRVKIVQGKAAVTETDRSFFSHEECEEGWRLACKCIPKETLWIETESTVESGFEVLGVLGDNADAHSHPHSLNYILGIDIGTTTIAMALQNAENGQLAEEYLALNRQRMYGADVVNRIQASVEGRVGELQTLIREDLRKGIWQLTGNGQILPKQIVIAGNTTMIHLLMGYPCHGLGQYPFTPYHIGEIAVSVGELLGESDGGAERDFTADILAETKDAAWEKLKKIPVHILPGISAFVGADIVADILQCGMAEDAKVSMLIDVGTNGEMAVGNRDRILVTSTAAGPAFEGGNISCGTGSVPGAICGVDLRKNTQITMNGGAGVSDKGPDMPNDAFEISLRTIQDAAPAGICGTGTIEVIYELLQAGLIDETGYMEEDEFVLTSCEDGSAICFTQKDVRQLQLAKAAIRAGIETLLLRYGVTVEEVDTVYLAGGFGYHINMDKAMGIGLFPEGFRGKIKLLGNGSLRGALLYGKQACQMEHIVGVAEEVSLAADRDFNELYLEYMSF